MAGSLAAPPSQSTAPLIDAGTDITLTKLAAYHVPVLITGESGTGKEVLARRLHHQSARADAPFVPINCGAIPPALVESQLFGHVRGAFTGADREALGLLRAADGGTVLLDEVGELSASAQVALLRCIQERSVVPVGGTDAVAVDIRIVAATHRDLDQMQRQAEFRSDLFYRLNVMQLHQPPLRERGQAEIKRLAQHLMQRVAAMHDEPAKQLDAQAMKLLCSYRWPGNVRELANTIEHGFVMAEGDTVKADDFPEKLQTHEGAGETGADSTEAPVHRAQRDLLCRALDQAGGSKAEAARLLGLQRQTLYRLLARYELTPAQSADR